MTSITTTPQLVRTAADANPLMDRVEQIREASVDALTDTRGLALASSDRRFEADPTRNVWMEARTKDGIVRLRVLEGAHRQLADKTGIPQAYYRRMLETQPDLLAVNVNLWLTREPEKRLLRLIRPLTDEDAAAMEDVQAEMAVRAILSDRYRPLDNGALLNAILPAAVEHGARVTSWSLDEKRLHVVFATEEQEILQRFVAQQPRLHGLEEIVSFGFALCNSETGHSAIRVQPSVNIKRCTNVLRVSDMYRVMHLGGRNEEEENFFRTDTRRLDDASTFLKVRDRIIQILGEDEVAKVAQHIATGRGTPLELPEELPVMEFVSNVGKRFDLTESEVSILQDEFVSEVGATGDRTKWSLSQAFTATARKLGKENPDRRAELEEVGWQVLGDPISKLLRTNK